MALRDILDQTLRAIPENQLVLIVTADTGFEVDNTGIKERNYLLRWGGFQDDPYSVDGSEAHLYANGAILRLSHLDGVWGNQPVQIPIRPVNSDGKSAFCLVSEPLELALGKKEIVSVLAKYQLSAHRGFIEQQYSP